MTGRAVFLDRDGVLNRLVERNGELVSPRELGEFQLVETARSDVERLKSAGFRVFVVTNQPDIARGALRPAVLDEMSELLRTQIGVDEVVVCGHDDTDRCACRKPLPGMLLNLAERHAIDLERSLMVGDTWRDMQAGKSARCTTILIGEAPDVPNADHRAASLHDAVTLILARQ